VDGARRCLSSLTSYARVANECNARGSIKDGTDITKVNIDGVTYIVPKMK
jgi:hypothetical protein